MLIFFLVSPQETSLSLSLSLSLPPSLTAEFFHTLYCSLSDFRERNLSRSALSLSGDSVLLLEADTWVEESWVRAFFRSGGDGFRFVEQDIGGFEATPVHAIAIWRGFLLDLFEFVDQYLGFEEMEGDEDEWRPEFPCPLCDEDFDIVGLCSHIDDDHPFEAKNGVLVCTYLSLWNFVELVCHGYDLYRLLLLNSLMCAYSQHKRRLRKGSSGSHGALNFLRKEVRDGSLQSLLGGSSRLITPSHAAPDPLLSSFISNVPIADSSRIVEPEPLDEGINKISEEKMVERYGKVDVFLCNFVLWHYNMEISDDTSRNICLSIIFSFIQHLIS
ncbi:hypothetical protein IEQ34_026634 [Dendrobium chrysotoxum]|uniref:Uncharacterized protein n=1 Tax=Dendrobium chrysotoxum TaxID=161865 RepID=A0AAV7FLN8_DENCH|nr:hypothetical protein IEQ34_026634 [Dendrobium chrysotoxum]